MSFFKKEKTSHSTMSFFSLSREKYTPTKSNQNLSISKYNFSI